MNTMHDVIKRSVDEHMYFLILYLYLHFFWLSWVVTSSTGMVLDICVDFIMGTPKGSAKVVFWRSHELNLRHRVYKAYAYSLHHGDFSLAKKTFDLFLLYS